MDDRTLNDSTPSTTPAKPPTDRLIGLDVARCFAVYGMVVVNFTLVMGATDNGPDWLVAVAGLLTGRASATFVVLAGIGVTLQSRQAWKSDDPLLLRDRRRVLCKRSLFLFVVGLAYFPLWPADILHYYGIYIAVGALALNASSRLLWGLATCFAAVFMILLMTLDYSAGWRWETLTYLDFWTPKGFVRNLFFNGFHPVFPWTAFLLVGMWLGRQDLHKSATRWPMLAGAVVAVTLTEIVSHLLIRQFAPGEANELRYVLGTASMPPTPFYLLSSGCTAVAVILLTLALVERFPSRCWEPLANTGQLAFTLYVAHVVLGLGLLEELGLFQGQTLVFALAYSSGFCVVAVLACWLWRRRFARGPLEWVMRRLT